MYRDIISIDVRNFRNEFQFLLCESSAEIEIN